MSSYLVALPEAYSVLAGRLSGLGSTRDAAPAAAVMPTTKIAAAAGNDSRWPLPAFWYARPEISCA